MLDIRQYTPADESACLAVLESNIPIYFVPTDIEDFRQFLRAPSGDYFVGQVDGAIRACGGCYVKDSGVAGLTWGMVHAADHRRGLGSELLRYRLETIRRVPQARCVSLNTTQVVAPFFDRFGFQTDRVMENGYAQGLHKVSMRLLL